MNGEDCVARIVRIAQHPPQFEASQPIGDGAFERTKLIPESSLFLTLEQRQHLTGFVNLDSERIVLSDPGLVLLDLG
jgi:hypothetical protein